MTPQDRELIQSVFDRLARLGPQAKDPEAERLIAERAGQLPDATYTLVQAVVVQDLTLRQAQAHVAELERQLAEARAAVPAQAGSFLPPGNPWAQPAPQSAQMYSRSAIPQTAPQPVPQMAPQAASPWGQQPQGGGFLRTAATMAAGVAGGTLLAEGITSLFGGGHHFGGGFGSGLGAGPTTENVTVNNYYGSDAVPDDAGYDADTDGDLGGYDDSQDV
jgi:hypothetical protein